MIPSLFSQTESRQKTKMLKYIQARNITIDVKQLIASKPLIYNDLKLMLYKYHLGYAGYYRAHNLTDNVVKQALASLQ